MGSGARSRTKPTSIKAIPILIGSSHLFTDQVFHVLVILVTGKFQNFLGCWSERGNPSRLPGHLESAGVVKRGFNFEMPQIGPPKACCHTELVRVRYGFSQPCLVVEADRVDHQSVSFPRSDGVSSPRRVEIFRMSPSVEVNLAIARDVVLNDRDEEIPALYDPVQKEIEWCHGERKAVSLRVVFKIVVGPLLLEGLSPWKQFRSSLNSAARQRTIPNSRKVRFAIRRARCRTFGRLWPAENQSAEICPVLPERFQGNEITDWNVGA